MVILRRKYKKAFVDKDEAKLLCYALMHVQFESVFGSTGFKSHGKSENGPLLAKLLTIKQQNREAGIRFEVTIDEASGIKEPSGAVKAIPGSAHDSVQTFVSLQEIYSYIAAEEIKAVQDGEPLHTLLYYETSAAQEPKPSTQEELPEDFVIDVGALSGKRLGELSDHELNGILLSKVVHPKIQEIQDKAKRVLERRS